MESVERLLTPHEAAKVLNVSRTWMHKHLRDIPHSVLNAGTRKTRRYRMSDLMKFVEKTRVTQ